MGGILLALVALFLVGCLDDDGMAVDGGTDGAVDGAVDGAIDADAGGAAVADIPWLDDGVPPIVPPALACPDGWREVTDSLGVTTCDPFPEGGALTCAAGEAHFPGELGCASVGAPCPSGDFADGLPSDARVVYVQPGADGDGTPGDPYGGFADFSLGGLPPGSVIALSSGAHAGSVTLQRGHVLWGACAGQTTLSTTVPHETVGVVSMTGEGGEVRNLTIADSPRMGVSMMAGTVRGVIDGVVVTGTETAALQVFLGTMEVHSSVLRDTRSRTRGGQFGRGLELGGGGTVSITRTLLERNRDVAFSAVEASTLTLTDVVVRDMQGRAGDGELGRGLDLQRGSSATVTRALFERTRDAALLVSGTGTRLMASDIVVRDTQDTGLARGSGRGLILQAGATAEVARAVLENNSDISVLVTEANLTLSDAVVRNTESSATGLYGRGIGIQSGSVATVSRALVTQSHEVGVFVSDANVTLTDVCVRETQPQATDMQLGRGIDVSNGATVDLRQAVVERNSEIGVFVNGAGASMSLTDVIVRDTDGRASDGLSGRGVAVQLGATLNGTRMVVERNREFGVVALEAEATLEDIVVRDTLPRLCAETTCPAQGFGHGVASVEGASVTMTRFIVARSHECGVHIERDGQMDLSHGEIRDNPIGICVQVAGYDLSRLMDDVLFEDNVVNVQTTMLPTP